MTLNFNEIRPLNEVRYTARDYVTALDRILRHIRDELSSSGFNNFVASDPAMLLALIGSFIVDQLSFYANRQMSDAFLTTARSHASILRHARSLGYRIRPATAASLPVRLTFPALTAPAVLPSGFSFSADGLVFEVLNDIPLSLGATQVELSIREGATSQVAYTATGERLLELILQALADGEYIADHTIRVIVNGVQWTESAFLTFDPTPQYEVDYLSTPPVVRFGDGASGKIPALNHDVQIRYVVCHGRRGNVGADVKVTPRDQLLVSGQPVNLGIEVLGPATGGNEPESLEQVRTSAPRYFASREKAVTKEDYVSLSLGFSDPAYGSISKATALVSRDVTMDGTASALFTAISEAAQASLETLNSSRATIRLALNLITSYRNALSVILGPLRPGSATLNTLSTSRTELDGIRAQWAGGLPIVLASRQRASTELAALSSQISAAPISPTVKAQLLDRVSIVDSVLDSMVGQIAVLQGQPAAIQEIMDNLLAVSTTLQGVAASALGESAKIGLQVDKIGAENDDLAGIAPRLDSILSSVALLISHVSGVLRSDCKANFVLVTVLSRDSRGQLSSPSQGLMRSLQEYLRDRCDVSHFVRVVSGYDSVVPAQVVAKFALLTGAVRVDVESAIQKRVNELIAAFDNGQPLNLDMLYGATDDLDGIKKINFTIAGPTSRVDGDGNLVPLGHEIVSLGSLTLSLMENG